MAFWKYRQQDRVFRANTQCIYILEHMAPKWIGFRIVPSFTCIPPGFLGAAMGLWYGAVSPRDANQPHFPTPSSTRLLTIYSRTTSTISKLSLRCAIQSTLQLLLMRDASHKSSLRLTISPWCTPPFVLQTSRWPPPPPRCHPCDISATCALIFIEYTMPSCRNELETRTE